MRRRGVKTLGMTKTTHFGRSFKGFRLDRVDSFGDLHHPHVGDDEEGEEGCADSAQLEVVEEGEPDGQEESDDAGEDAAEAGSGGALDLGSVGGQPATQGTGGVADIQQGDW